LVEAPEVELLALVVEETTIALAPSSGSKAEVVTL